MDSEMTQDILFEMNRNISRGSNMLTQLLSYEPPKWASSLKDIPQFFVQVSNFDITR